MEKIYLKDYQAPHFQIPETFLSFDIQPDGTRVHARLSFKKTISENTKNENLHWHKKAPVDPSTDLKLEGEDLTLEDIQLNGQPLVSGKDYELRPNSLVLKNPPAEFTLETRVKIHPDKNTALSGLYKAGENLMTQCEAQGFRRITYYMDRPDVMSSFKVQIEADKTKYPVLLSNGDRIETKDLPGGRHQAVWKDPHKKPAYLFAMVAGDLAKIEDSYKTGSGKSVKLEIYAEKNKIDQCDYAMESLKKAMEWDEKRFGLEYDLSTYMIVATDDFNAGAMENKGLNIFNSRLVLANLETASDQRFEAIESVVAHEYFHNWTGNRVTLRDWFHLSLKEGLTVFRDQEFSMDQISRDQVRIQNVIDLRESQFAEDQGPNSHPIRPESCFSVDNFFTSTIYEKGAEVIRMMQTMVGRPGFRQGMDLYFQRHDGQAVIIEDFAQAIADGNKIPQGEWDQFKLWYSQAGTPKIKVEESFDANKKTYRLKLTQSCAPTPGQPTKKPFHIPLELQLLSPAGKPIAASNPKLQTNSEGKTLVHLKQAAEELIFENLNEKPILSLNRGFSAPVELEWDRPLEESIFLFQHDTDAFNRWEAGQKLFQQEFQELLRNPESRPNSAVKNAMLAVLKDEQLPNALKATMLTFPSLGYLAQIVPGFKAEKFETAYHSLWKNYGAALKPELAKIYERLAGKPSQKVDPQARGDRALKNWSLAMLCWEGSGSAYAEKQFQDSKLMTDQESSLYQLIQHTNEPGHKALQAFFERWKDDKLSLNAWWRLQSTTERPETFDTVKRLARHERFQISNPNAVYMLLRGFGDNLTRFHRGDGETYEWMAGKVLEIDRLNPQVAARVAACFDFCLKVEEPLKQKAKQSLKALVDQKPSSNTFEIISRVLAGLEAKA